MKSDKDMELLDIEDQAATVGKLSPSEYAKLRGLAPQLVYYYLRTSVLKEERCACGRKVIDVLASDEALQTQKNKRGGIDKRSDQRKNV